MFNHMEKKPINIPDEQLKKIVKESVKAALTEASINAKRRNDNNVIGAIKGGKAGYNGIKTIAVFTAQNPDSTSASPTFNRRVNRTLLKALKDSHYACVPVEGHWGGVPERSYAVINISPEAAAWFTGRFQQTSFIYSKVGDGTVMTDYYEKQDTNAPYDSKTNPYVVKDSAAGYVDMSGADSDFSVVGKKFSYKIDFPTFRSINETISKNFEEELSRGEKSLFHNRTLDEEIDFTIHRVGQSPSIHRGSLYRGLI